MAIISRYDSNGKSIANKIFFARKSNSIDFKLVVTETSKRLDHYAYDFYEESLNWWVIAAASGIGWWLQVPPGTVLYIPTDLTQIENLK
tara:strand:+ start:56 stop:322 length:267 start_codon:yes stop_codon:yes gene_type:complete